MSLTKLGTKYYQGQERPVYLLCGNATRSAEDRPVNGNNHAQVGIAAVERKDGTTTFINLNGWRGNYRDVLSIRKGDCILAVGELKEREYNGKKYYDLDADFVARSGAGLTGFVPEDSTGFTPAAEGVTVSGPGFAELEDDGELPFD